MLGDKERAGCLAPRPIPSPHRIHRHEAPSASRLSCGFIATLAAQEPDAKPNFSSQSELVVLHVAVKDRKGGYVGGLPPGSFRVLEDRRPQEISFFNSQDAPVTVGLLIDASGIWRPIATW